MTHEKLGKDKNSDKKGNKVVVNTEVQKSKRITMEGSAWCTRPSFCRFGIFKSLVILATCKESC